MAKQRKSIFKRWWFWVIAVIVIIIISMSANNGGASSNPADSQPATSNSVDNTMGSNNTTKNTTSSSKSTSASPDFTVKVMGTKGIKFSGDIDVISSDGSSNSETKSGSVPKTYIIKKGAEVSVVLQKSGTSGTLKVEILHKGKVVKESSTSAQYGAVTVSSPMY